MAWTKISIKFTKGNNSKNKKNRVPVLVHCLYEIYQPMKFQAHNIYKSLEMAQTKIKYENQQRAIIQKIKNAEYRFLCTALLPNEIYHPMKFQVHSFYS
jgi:hypothetical protein